MKNVYGKFVKYLVKQDNIYFQRVDESVYLSDGKIVLMVPAPVYAAEIRPLSGLLPDTTGDCTGVKRHSDFAVKIVSDGTDIKACVDNMDTSNVIAASRFLLEMPLTGKRKPITVRLFRPAEGGDIIAVNNVFVDMFADCSISDKWTGAGKWNTPLIKRRDGYMQVMLPMRVDTRYFDFWKELPDKILKGVTNYEH